MRLERLDLARYGHFTDKRLDFPAPASGEPDLHIVFGPNEAGKSTLFSGWLDFLFGIPARSRHDFLHPGPTMRIAAQLSHASGALELARVKRNAPSLLDAHGGVVPETVLQAVLGGLTRGGYASMFSLDDDTLEQGGDSILASRGDLGEMLFSASAGLAGLGPQLDVIRAEMDAFHRPGARKGGLRDAKARLAELDRQRRDLDTSAAAMERLRREMRSAERDWTTAREAEQAASVELQQVQAALALLPQRERLDRLERELAPIQSVPDTDDDQARLFRDLEDQRIALTSRIAERTGRVETLERKLAALPLDTAVLAQRPAIAEAEALRPAHDTALQDLPRRRTEAQESQTTLQQALVLLGCTDAKAETLLLDPARLSRLRGLLARHSGITATASSSKAEADKARDRLATARNRLGDPGQTGETGALQLLVTRFRSADPVEAAERARREMDEQQAKLAAALARLAPWQGEAEALAALSVPASWQIERWQADEDRTRLALAEAGHGLSLAVDALRRTEAEAAPDQTSGPTLAEAAARRSRREALWATHRARLDPASADAFEAALREDDRISALLADAMAEARQAANRAAGIKELKAAVATADQQQEQAQAARLAHDAAIANACDAIGLQGAGLADLACWLDLRLAALAEHTTLRLARDALARAETGLNAAATALRAALDLSADKPFEVLLAKAMARLAQAEQRRQARQQLAELQEDLGQREADRTEAEKIAASWLSDWQGAASGTLLAGQSIDVEGMSRVLDLVDALGQTQAQLAGLNDRIAKMAANRDAFRDAAAAALAALDLPEETPWPQVQARLRKAEDDASETVRLKAALLEETTEAEEDARHAATNRAALHELGMAIGWAENNGRTLADHLADALKATRLRREIAELGLALAAQPDLPEQSDHDELLAQEAALQGRVDLLRSETQERFAALAEARRRVNAVGGDDAVARIESERANLLNDLREAARNHLTGRFGLAALETGLRRYRDNHRSAMLTRASDAFCQLSRGAYSALSAQPEGTQEVLVAQSHGRGAKLAADMSKGTRFQLYLALRIAGYHELAKSRTTVPFIADDIMETFDDDRAAEAFALLGDMSRSGQVIYLTHHRHLCDIARTACPAARVIDL